jgi:hypothetical protein
MRPTRTTIVPLAAVLAAGLLTTPAIAHPIDSTAARPYAHSETAPLQDLRSPDAIDAEAGRGTFNAPDVTVIKVPQPARSPHGGVDWADAAIGAGGATGLLAISLAGAMALRRRQGGARARAAVS